MSETNQTTEIVEVKKKKSKAKKGNSVVVVGSKTEDGLTLLQEEFCKLFTTNDTEFYGNGTQSYMQAFGKEFQAKNKRPLTYKSAQVLAYKELRKVKIIDRINSLLDSGGFNDQNVDKQHLFLINQYADLRTKLGAVKEYNELKKRVDKPPGGISFNFTLTDEQLRRIAEGISNGNRTFKAESSVVPDSDKSKILAELAPQNNS